MSTHADIMFWAFRYALPRHTYAVNEVATYIARHVDDLDPKARALMVKEIDEQLAADCNLWQCDRDDWARLREALTKHKPTTPMTRILLYLRRFEAWFNARFGWFFTNPNKLDRWEREAWEKRDQ